MSLSLQKPLTLLALCASLLGAPAHAADPVVVYSARNAQLIEPLFAAFTRDTGTPVQFITDKEGPLLARLKAEGRNTRADVLMTVDAGNLWQAAQEDLLQPLDSPALRAAIPAHLRDPQQRWWGLSVRARTIAYNPQRVQPSQLSTYEDLADPKWKGRLCLRTSKKVYNQSLVAMLIAEHGAPKTEALVRGWVANLATPPFADDTQALQAVAQGVCDVTLVNTYYFGRLMHDQPQLSLALFWPNQAVRGSGVHVNVSGAGVTRHAKHPALARQLIEWLATPKAQSLYADVDLEYPARADVPPTAQVAAWGRYTPNPRNVADAGQLQAQAVMLMDRAGYR